MENEKYKDVFSQVKIDLVLEMKQKNEKLLFQCLKEIKENHFIEMTNVEELSMKKAVTASTLEQYGIPSLYLMGLAGDIESTIHLECVRRNEALLQQKQI